MRYRCRPSYYDQLQSDYRARRDLILPELERAGFGTFSPDGAYYIMTDISAFGFKDDVEFTRHLIREIGVACVPGSSFYSDPALGAQQVRFCFCKKDETLLLAAERLKKASLITNKPVSNFKNSGKFFCVWFLYAFFFFFFFFFFFSFFFFKVFKIFFY